MGVKTLFAICCGMYASLLTPVNAYAGIWTTPTAIPGAPTADSPAFSSVDSDGNVMVSWLNNSSDHLPYYAIYNGTSWSTPAAIPGALETVTYIFSSVDADGNFMLTWANNSDSLPYYAIYNGTSWTTPAAVAGTTSTTPFNVYSSVDADGNFIVSWYNSAAGGLPYYAIYNGSSWSTPAAIPGATAALSGIFSSVDSDGNFLFSWRRLSDGLPYYAVYNGTSWTVAPQAIAGTTDPSVSSFDIFSSVDSTGNFIVTWVNNADNLPYYAVYNGSSWIVSPQAIAETTDPVATGSFVFSSSDAFGSSMATWLDDTTNLPYYALYNGTSWSVSPTEIPDSASTILSVFSSVNSNGQFMVNWFNNADDLPYYALFTQGPTPSSSFTGNQKVNNFGTVSERFNTLQWTASASSGVLGYYLFRNGTLIATLASTKTSYQDHNRKKSQADTYSLQAFSASGISAAVTVTIGG